MSIDQKPTIVVAGSLSKQGRSVTESLLGSGRYHVRALTSRTDSPAALKLAEQGAEL
ncbi:NmrA/HSCARG family protein, partial [Rhizobium tropici]